MRSFDILAKKEYNYLYEDGKIKSQENRPLVSFCPLVSLNIGGGHLTHTKDGFKLISDDGTLCYDQPPELSYSLYSDYYWYEIGDMVCIGNGKVLYYCFPKDKSVSVAKVRLAAEELFKIVNEK